MLETVDKDGMALAEGGDDLNEILVHVFANIEGSAVGIDSEDALKRLFADFDPNSPKLGNTVIERIVAREQELRSAIGTIIADLEGGSDE